MTYGPVQARVELILFSLFEYLLIYFHLGVVAYTGPPSSKTRPKRNKRNGEKKE